MTMEVNSNFTSKPCVNHVVSSISRPVSRKKQAHALLERVHQVITTLLCTAELDMANTVETSDIDVFLTDATWAMCSTYHTVLKASPGAAIFGQDMLFGIPFLSDWNKIGDDKQCQTDLNTEHENCSCHDWDYRISDNCFLEKMDPLQIRTSVWKWSLTITSVHTNGTIRVQHWTKSEWLIIRRVRPIFNDQT